MGTNDVFKKLPTWNTTTEYELPDGNAETDYFVGRDQWSRDQLRPKTWFTASTSVQQTETTN